MYYVLISILTYRHLMETETGNYCAMKLIEVGWWVYG